MKTIALKVEPELQFEKVPDTVFMPALETTSLDTWISQNKNTSENCLKTIIISVGIC